MLENLRQSRQDLVKFQLRASQLLILQSSLTCPYNPLRLSSMIICTTRRKVPVLVVL